MQKENEIIAIDYDEYRKRLENIASPRQFNMQIARWREQFANDELPKVYSETGLDMKNKNIISSPFRDDRNPSFSVSKNRSGDSIVFHDFGSSEYSGSGVVAYRYAQRFGKVPSSEEEEQFIIDEAINRQYPQILQLDNAQNNANGKVYIDLVKQHINKQAAVLSLLKSDGLITLQPAQDFIQKPYLQEVVFSQNVDSKALAAIIETHLNTLYPAEDDYTKQEHKTLALATVKLFSSQLPKQLVVFDKDFRAINFYNTQTGMLELPLHKFDKGLSLTPLNFQAYLSETYKYNLANDPTIIQLNRDNNIILKYRDEHKLNRTELLVTHDFSHFRDCINQGIPVALLPNGFYEHSKQFPRFTFDYTLKHGNQDARFENTSALRHLMSKIYAVGTVEKVKLDLFIADAFNEIEKQYLTQHFNPDEKATFERATAQQQDKWLQHGQHVHWISTSLSLLPPNKELSSYVFIGHRNESFLDFSIRMAGTGLNNEGIPRFSSSFNRILSRAKELSDYQYSISTALAEAKGGQRNTLLSKGALRNYPMQYPNIQMTIGAYQQANDIINMMFDKEKRAKAQTSLWNMSYTPYAPFEPRETLPNNAKPLYDVIHQRYLDLNRLSFEKTLKQRDNPIYREFIVNRHIDTKDSYGQSIEDKFGLGYATGGEFSRSFNEILGVYPQVTDDKQQHGNLFKERITFPIRDEHGQVVGFGGRTTENTPEMLKDRKYLNSATPDDLKTVYNKNQVYYGLYESKQDIINKNELIVVEGYMDCIACHIAGFENAVATCGTQLPVEKLHKALEYADSVKIMLDGDKAGLKAMDMSALKHIFRKEQGFDLVYSPNKHFSFVNLPNDLDPDEYMNQYGIESLKSYLDNAIPAEDYAILATYRQTFLRSAEKGYIELSVEEQKERQTDPFYQGLFFQRLNELLKDVAEEYPDVAKNIRSKAQRLISHANAIKGMALNAEIGKTEDELAYIFIKEDFKNPYKQMIFPQETASMQSIALEHLTIKSNEVNSLIIEQKEEAELNQVAENKPILKGMSM